MDREYQRLLDRDRNPLQFLYHGGGIQLTSKFALTSPYRLQARMGDLRGDVSLREAHRAPHRRRRRPQQLPLPHAAAAGRGGLAPDHSASGDDRVLPRAVPHGAVLGPCGQCERIHVEDELRVDGYYCTACCVESAWAERPQRVDPILVGRVLRLSGWFGRLTWIPQSLYRDIRP